MFVDVMKCAEHLKYSKQVMGKLPNQSLKPVTNLKLHENIPSFTESNSQGLHTSNEPEYK